MNISFQPWLCRLFWLLAIPGVSLMAQPDVIFFHGKIVSVNASFSVHQAMAVAGNRITEIGTDQAVLVTKGPNTRLVDLQGKMVLPGLIDSHVHPESAALTEFDHPIPEMETISDVLNYIQMRVATLGPDKWVEVRQVFITRLKEQRYPTRAELDRVSPENPVLFATGPDASLNSLALRLSGIDKAFQVNDGGPGRIEHDPDTGEPTGILRSCTRLVKVVSPEHLPTAQDQEQRLIALFQDYNSVGLTSIGDRDASAEAVERYRGLRGRTDLTVRVSISQHVETLGPLPDIVERIRHIARDPLRQPDPSVQIIGIKTYLDGGMLTGSAYLRAPWGLSSIYSITDPAYRGLLFISEDRLLPIVRATLDSGLQFTAHSVGDGAVHALLDVYEQLDRTAPIHKLRPCITHANFMSAEAVSALGRLGVVVDVQPVWLYLDTRTLVSQFGYDRLRYFQPLRSLFAAGAIAGGGSDHMQKVGSMRAINPYNPFLGMETAITRRARWFEGSLHPEEALTREQAIRFYTANNAYLLFREQEVGSLERGKRADFIILDRDILACPEGDIHATEVLATYFDGRLVFQRR